MIDWSEGILGHFLSAALGTFWDIMSHLPCSQFNYFWMQAVGFCQLLAQSFFPEHAMIRQVEPLQLTSPQDHGFKREPTYNRHQ